MAKPNIVTSEMWAKIKTEYEFGGVINQIARDFSLAHTTILRKAKKEGWVHGQYTKEVSDAKQIFDSVHNSVHKDQQPIVRAKFLSMIERQELINNFIDGAISANLKNLQAVHKEPDAEKRIKMIQQMKATMVDLAGVSQVAPALKDAIPQDNANPEDDSAVKIYIPDNGRDE